MVAWCYGEIGKIDDLISDRENCYNALPTVNTVKIFENQHSGMYSPLKTINPYKQT